MTTDANRQEIREVVRQRYAEAARAVGGESTARSGCCGGGTSSCCGGTGGKDPISSNLYTRVETAGLPEQAVLASLGCGNPTALVDLRPGEVVLDLGSGGGIDVLLSARRVGPTGFAYGLDMTDEMLALAHDNARKVGATNVEFLKGHIEEIPLPDASVDVIISNCVINLSADKDSVLREAFRVLKPGGRFAVSDIVVKGPPLDERLQHMLALWAGCISGALTEDDYRLKLGEAGFVDIGLEVTRAYGIEDVPAEAQCCAPDGLDLLPGQQIVAAFVRATKPKLSPLARSRQ